VRTETTLNITDGKKIADNKEDVAGETTTEVIKIEVIRINRKMAITADNGIINPQDFKNSEGLTIDK
jgi:hypothetical protein